MVIQRGEIYYADLSSNTVGSEQGGIRPVVVIQNNVGNQYSPTTIIAIITSKSKRRIPTHVYVHKDEENGLKCNSVVALEQIRTIDKQRLREKIGHLSENDTNKVMAAMKVSLAMM